MGRCCSRWRVVWCSCLYVLATPSISDSWMCDCIMTERVCRLGTTELVLGLVASEWFFKRVEDGNLGDDMPPNPAVTDPFLEDPLASALLSVEADP